MNQTTIKPPVKLRYILAGALAFGFVGGVIWHFLAGDDSNLSLSELPVIEAPEGPSKIKPIEPGGVEIAHRDKEVFTVFDPAARTANATKEPTIVTPEQPAEAGEKTIDVEWKDVSKKAEEGEAKPAESGQTLVLSNKEEPKPAEPAAVAEPVAPQEVAQVEQPKEEAPAAPAVKEEVKEEPKAEPKVIPVAAAKPKGQQYYLQLGAFKSKENANHKIASLKKSHPTAVKSVSFDVRERTGKNKSFYALCTTAMPKDQAQKLFNTFKSNKVDCFLVKETK